MTPCCQRSQQKLVKRLFSLVVVVVVSVVDVALEKNSFIAYHDKSGTHIKCSPKNKYVKKNKHNITQKDN